MQDKKVILITGTSTGLGLKTAIKLAGNPDHIVYASMRDLSKKAQLEKEAQDSGVALYLKRLDVSDQQSIDACVKEIQAEQGRIDVLINNAGAGFLKASELVTERDLLQVTDINYFGVVRCTNAVLPVMRAQRSGHIINIGSVGGLVGQPFNELYCAAKFAVEGYTEALATYMGPSFGIHFTVVEPGGITTEFAKSALKKVAEDPMDNGPYAEVFQKYIGSMQNRTREEIAKIYQTGEEVAALIASCIGSENPPVRMRTSAWSEEFTHYKTSGDPDGLLLAEKLRNTYFKS